MTILFGLAVMAPLGYLCYKALLNAPPALFDWPSITLPSLADRERQP
jgi:hypothetical protein